MKKADEIIKSLNLTAHPEGGYYKETYRSVENIPEAALPKRFKRDRSTSTAIYFLLKSDEPSKLHRIKSDESWFFHQGTPLVIHSINEAGIYKKEILGLDLQKKQSPQITVDHDSWFGAEVIEPNSFTLVSCTVSPGFDFSDFELADQDDLLKIYPQFSKLIKKLT